MPHDRVEPPNSDGHPGFESLNGEHEGDWIS